MCESSTRYELQIEFYSFCYSKHWIIHSSSSPFIQAWHDETQPWILLEQWVYWKWYPFFNHHYSSLCHRCHRHVNLQYELDTNLRRANCISNFIILYGKLQMWWGPCSGPSKCFVTTSTYRYGFGIIPEYIRSWFSMLCIVVIECKTLCWPIRESIISY